MPESPTPSNPQPLTPVTVRVTFAVGPGVACPDGMVEVVGVVALSKPLPRQARFLHPPVPPDGYSFQFE